MVIALLVSSIHHCAIARTYTPFFFFFLPAQTARLGNGGGTFTPEDAEVPYCFQPEF